MSLPSPADVPVYGIRSSGGAGIVADERAQYLPSQSRPAVERPPLEALPKLHRIDLRLLDGLRRLRRSEPMLSLAEGRELARLRKVHDRLGGSFGDVVRERLGISLRRAQERITLALLASRAPDCGEALLSGELSMSKVLALKPVIEHSLKTSAPLAPWIADAGSMNVRALRQKVREAQDSGALSTGDSRTASSVPAVQPWDPDEEGRWITIEAPPIFWLVWDLMIEYGQRMLGRKAPQYACLEAVLCEAAPECGTEVLLDRQSGEASGESRQVSARDSGTGSGANRQVSARPLESDSDSDSGPVPDPIRQLSARHDDGATLLARRADRAALLARRAEPPVMSLKFAEEDIAKVDQHLEDVRGIVEDGAIGSDEPRDAEDLLLRIREIHALARPGDVLEASLVRDLRDTWAIDRLGFENFEDFAHRELGLSDRAARDLRYVARVFEDSPTLASAYGENKIGIASVLQIHKVACRKTVPQYLRRARKVLPCELARELKLRDRLDQLDPTLAAVWTPQPSTSLLEIALFARLGELGQTREQIDAFLASRSLIALRTREPEGKVSDDPAETPWRMRRLEVLVDLLTLTLCEESAGAPQVDRQLSARPEAESSGTVPGAADRAGAESSAADRAGADAASGATTRHLSARLGRSQALRTRRKTLWLPHAVADHLDRAAHLMQEAYVVADASGNTPILPLWGCILLLIESAFDVWKPQDPEAVPVNLKILERDNWGCLTPVCSCRQNLEGHHFQYRSDQGSDSYWNRGAVCKGDHRRIHAGYIKVKGRAPDGLIWLLGKTLLLKGARIIKSGRGAEAAFDAL